MDLHLVGGFLGSGKTTAIIEAARILTARGKRVGIITNEQGRRLVDTGFIRSIDLPALDVTEGCFCCHLDDFSERIEEIAEKYNPQVLFAESVGSCADLVATVIKPLVEVRKTSASPASLSVFTDCRLLQRWLRGQEMPFSENVMYIFEKQIEESGLLVVNKIDLLSAEDARAVTALAEKKYPEKAVRAQNSLDAGQVEEWLELIQSGSQPLPTASLDIDYDVYAVGERKFTWLEREYRITFPETRQILLIAKIIQKITQLMHERKLRIAHLKFLVSTDLGSVKISVTGEDDLNEDFTDRLKQVSERQSKQVRFLMNVMVEGDTEETEDALDEIVEREMEKPGIKLEESSRFKRVPGYPKPTMRIDS